jgi:HK97 family phage portal protein
MLHLRNMSKDGYLGLSPLSVAAEAIGIAEKAERRLSNIFKNRVGSEYKVELPNALTKEQFEQFRKQIEATYGQGMDIPIIAENGAKWNLMTINARDSQLIENRKFQVEDIARVFRVSLHMLQVEEAEKNSTGTSVEMKNRTFLDNTIVPHLTRLEQAYTNTLLDAEEIRSGLHIMADTSRFARADMKGRYESYRIGLGGGANPGFLSINDVRRKEREPLLDTKIGDVYYVPLNVKEAGTQPTEEDNG